MVKKIQYKKKFFANKILSAGYFNKAGGNYTQTIILFWPNQSTATCFTVSTTHRKSRMIVYFKTYFKLTFFSMLWNIIFVNSKDINNMSLSTDTQYCRMPVWNTCSIHNPFCEKKQGWSDILWSQILTLLFSHQFWKCNVHAYRW